MVLLKTYPLSADPINTERRWGRLTNSRTCQSAKKNISKRDSEIRILNFHSLLKNQAAKLITGKQVPHLEKLFTYKKYKI